MDEIRPRILPLPREEWTDPAREVFSFWGEPNSWEEGSKTNIMMVMANHPDLGKVYNLWGKHFLMSNTLGTRALELIVMRVAWRVQSAYEWHNHVGYAMTAGLSLDDIEAIKKAPADGPWNDQDRAILVAVDDLIDRNVVSDETWAILSSFYDRRQMMDLVFTVGHYVMTSWASALASNIPTRSVSTCATSRGRSPARPTNPARPKTGRIRGVTDRSRGGPSPPRPRMIGATLQPGFLGS